MSMPPLVHGSQLPPPPLHPLYPFPRRRALPLLYRPAVVTLNIVVPLVGEQVLQEGHQLCNLVLVRAGQVDVL